MAARAGSPSGNAAAAIAARAAIRLRIIPSTAPTPSLAPSTLPGDSAMGEMPTWRPSWWTSSSPLKSSAPKVMAAMATPVATSTRWPVNAAAASTTAPASPLTSTSTSARVKASQPVAVTFAIFR